MNQRIQAIADAAAKLFIRQGYGRTQISHIAKAAGVSVGTIYLDFAGKREIMHFILKSAIDPGFKNREFERPVTDELFAGLESEIAAFFEQSGNAFARHLKDPVMEYSFEELISDAFDLLARHASGCLFIEKNRYEFKGLAETYEAYRRKFVDNMTEYISAFIAQGTVRPLEHIGLTTTLIIEILSWWAMDMRYTSFETQDIPMDLAKKICMDNIVSAYKR